MDIRTRLRRALIERARRSLVSDSVTFFVEGVPAPKGSTRSFGVFRGGKGVHREFWKTATTNANKRTKPWQRMVSEEASISGVALVPMPRPVVIEKLEFFFPRPKNHFTWTKAAFGRLRDDAPTYPVRKNHLDIDKLERTILDALTGIAYDDDSQVVLVCEKQKRYCNVGMKPGAAITLRAL